MKTCLLLLFIGMTYGLHSQYSISSTSKPSYTSLNNAQCIAGYGKSVHVVWTEGEAGNEQVFYNRSLSEGDAWENERNISVQQYGSYPSIAVQEQVVHVVFMDIPGALGGIYYSRSKNNGDSWEPAVQLADLPGESSNPSLAISGQTLHLVWHEENGDSSDVYYKKSEDGGDTWTADRKLTTGTKEAKLASIASYQSFVHLVYQDFFGIQYRRSIDGGNNWSDEESPGYGDHPSITVSEHIVMAVWSAPTGSSNTEIFSSRSGDHGVTWGTVMQPMPYNNMAMSPHIASNGNFFFLVWNEMVSNTWSIRGAFSINGGVSWDFTFLPGHGQNFALRPFVLLLDDDVHICWTDKEGVGGKEDVDYVKHDRGNLFTTYNTVSWGFAIGAQDEERCNDMVTDPSGNIYLTGLYSRDVDFDPGPSVTLLSSKGGYDVFVAKYNSAGQLIWARSVGGSTHDIGHALTLDKQGNVYVTGYFENLVDFNPGTSTYSLQSHGGRDIFILKLNNNGQFISAFSTGGIYSDISYAISVDESGNIITTGELSGTADFDPGAGTHNLSTAGKNDIFVWILSPQGELVAAHSFGGPENDGSRALAIGSDHNIVLTGFFSDTVDFDPGPGVHQLEGKGNWDMFALALDNNGLFQWAGSAGTTSYELGWDVGIDSDGNIVIIGDNGKPYFDVDFGPSEYLINSTGNYVLKLDKEGQFIWAKGYRSSSLGSSNVVIDSLKNIYVLGSFRNLQLDGSNPYSTMSSNEEDDVYLMKMNSNGQFQWVNQFSGPDYEFGNALAVHGLTDIYVAGNYNSYIDLDPSIDEFLLPEPAGTSENFFLVKIVQGEPQYVTITETACESYWSPDGLVLWATSGTYQNIIPSSLGGDSVITVVLTIVNSTESTQTVSACEEFNSSGGNTWNASGIYQETLTNSVGCDSLVTYNLTILSGSTEFQHVTACNSYTTPSGEHTFIFSGTEVEVIPNQYGCDSIINFYVIIKHDQEYSYAVSTCEPYTTPDGTQTWNSSGTYTYTLATSAGCDSLITVDLTISELDLSVIANESSLVAIQDGVGYQWIDCATGLPVENGTSNIFQPAVDGIYAVILSKENCIDTSTCFAFTVVGTMDPTLASEVRIYPNPATTSLFIDSKLTGDFTVSLYSVLGTKIGFWENAPVIDVTNTVPGMYIVRFENALGYFERRVVIKG